MLEILYFFTGVLHGVDPSKGWLFAFYTYIHKRSLPWSLTALSLAWWGHVLAIITAFWTALPASRWAIPLALIFFGILGLRHFELLRPWSGVKTAFAASYILGFLHGSGYFLYALCGGDIFTALYLHVAGLMAGGAAAFIAAKIAGVYVLRKIWINYDLVWSAALLITAAYYLIT